MNIDVNPLANKGNGYKKSASIAIMTLLVFGAVGIVAYAPKSAFAAVTISTSSSQFYGPALERVLITDTSQTTAGNSIQPHIDVKRGSQILASADPTITQPGTSGTFELYLTTSNAPFNPLHPSNPSDYAIARINTVPTATGSNGHGGNTDVSMAVPNNLKDGDTIVISYGGQQAIVQFAKARVVAQIDRTVSGSGDKATVTLVDQNANIDPTAIDNFTASGQIITSQQGSFNFTGARFIEQGQNNAMFDLSLDLTNSTGNVINPSNGATLKGLTFPGTAQITLLGHDVYPNFNRTAGATPPYDAVINNTAVSSSQTITLQNTDGAVTLTSPVNIANGVSLQINDQDRNIDTKAKDTFNGPVCITMDTIVATSTSNGKFCDIPMQETAFNSGIFLPQLTDNSVSITMTSGDSFINDNASLGATGIFMNASTIAANNNLYIKYIDPAPQTSTQSLFQIVTTIGHVVGVISAPQTTVSLNSKFPLTITDNDLNTNSDTADSFTVTFSGDSSTENVGQQFPGIPPVKLGTLTFKAAGNSVTVGTPFTVTFIETGANTGVFTATNVDMQKINAAVTNGLKDGDQVEFKYHDYSENPVQTSTVQITVGNPPVTIDTDRSTVPNPAVPSDPANAGTAQVKFTISITDQKLNLNPGSIDSPFLGGAAPNALTITLTDKNGNTINTPIVGLSNNLGLLPETFTETGPSTGVFTYQYVIGSVDPSNAAALNNAKIKFTYNSGGSTSSTSVTMRTYDGAVSSTSSIVKNGDTVVITLTDPDLNRDNTIAEQASVRLHTTDDQVGTTDTTISNLQETGVDTGIFTKSIQIGKDVKVGSLTDNQFATTLEVHYADNAASDLSTADRELDLKVGTSTGSVTVTPTIVGPGTKVGIDVHDNDLNTNAQGVDLTVSTKDYLRITSDATHASVLSNTNNGGPQGEETGPNTGIFHTKLTLTPAKSSDVSGAFTGSGKEIFGTVLPGDTISLRYTDQKDAAGNKVTVATTFKVQSFDPVMKINKQSVGAGDSFMLTINDPDANTDGDAVDSVPVRVYSTSDAVGITLSALETGANTGNFTVSVPTTTGVSSGSVSVKTGDTVTVKYNDKYPADYASRVKQVVDPSKDFFFNVNIGTGQGLNTSNSTSVSNPATKNTSGQEITQITAGQQIVLATNVNNNNPVAQPYAVIVEVRDSDGVTQYLQWQTGTLPQGGSTGVGLSWTPDQAGTYTVRTFVVSDIANPQVLSQLASSTVTVV